MFGGIFVGRKLGGRPRRVVVSGLLAAVAAGSVLLLLARPALASETFVVNRTTSESDASLGDDICDTNIAAAGNQCTLRAAMQQANAFDNPSVPDEIHFNIPGDRTKVKTIKPTSELPAITQPVIIDGYTQPGSRKNTRATGAINAVPKYSSTAARPVATPMGW